MPISGPIILCEKTKLFNKQPHAQEETVPPFTASSGWLWDFCNQHSIHIILVHVCTSTIFSLAFHIYEHFTYMNRGGSKVFG